MNRIEQRSSDRGTNVESAKAAGDSVWSSTDWSGQQPPSNSLARRLRELGRQIVCSIKIRRPEFLVAEIPLIGIPSVSALSSPSELVSYPFLEVVLIILFLFNIGDLLNCLCDRDTDTAEKSHLASAVREVGTKSVLAQVACTAAIVLTLSSILAHQTDRPWLVACVVLGIVLSASYSVPPTRFKSRGVLQLIWYWGTLFFAPMLFTLLALSHETVRLSQILIPAAFSTVQSGIVLINNAEDYLEDRQQNIFTCSVELGLPLVISLACVLILVGGVALLSELTRIGYLNHAPEVYQLLLSLTSASLGWIVFSVLKVRKSVMSSCEQNAMVSVKRAAKFVPAWLTIIAWSTFVMLMIARWHQ